jgi:hypothetical protein
MISSIMQLPIGVQCAQKNKRFNFFKDANVKDDPYEAPIFAYSKEMDQLVEVNIINNEVEKKNYKTCMDGGMIESDDKEENTMPQDTMPIRCPNK